MKLIYLSLAASLIAGCMTSSVPPVTYWTITDRDVKPIAEKAKYGVLRVSQITVCQPYDTRSLVVKRADGSVAFDPYNQFSVQPSQMVRSPIIAALYKSGVFKDVVWSTSSAVANLVAEVIVTDLSLTPGSAKNLTANVGVVIRLLDDRRNIIAVVDGSGSAQVPGGSYTDAFSSAMANAMKTALSGL